MRETTVPEIAVEVVTQVVRTARAGVVVGARFGLQTAERGRPVLAALLGELFAMIPVNEIINRVDIETLVTRVDVNVFLDQVDIPALVAQVVSGLELGDLIRDSTTSVAAEARDVVRVHAAAGDRALAGRIDRLLRRGALDRGTRGLDFGGAT
jgi:hypothetical protein